MEIGTYVRIGPGAVRAPCDLQAPPWRTGSDVEAIDVPDTTTKGYAMLVYMVERVYRDGLRPASVLSIWSSLDRAQAWAERNTVDDDGESHVAIRVQDVEVSAAAAS